MRLRDVFFAFLPCDKHGKRRSLYTRRKYQFDLFPFIQRYADLTAAEITAEHVREWFDDLERGRGLAEGTLAKHRSQFVSFFNHCMAEGLCQENPALVLPRFSDKPQVIRLPREDEVEQALAAAEMMSHSEAVTDRRNAAIFVTCYAYGNRRGELKNASYRDFWSAVKRPIERGKQTLYLLTTIGKGGRARLVLGERQKAYILRYLQLAPKPRSDSLFMNVNPHDARFRMGMSDTAMDRARWRVLKVAGVGSLTYHDLRRLRGTEVAREFSPEAAALVLNHKHGTRVLRDFYYDPDEEAALEAALSSLKF